VCSYNAPNFLFPPLELMYLSAQAKLVEGSEVRLLDCIAERLTPEDCLAAARDFRPDVVLAIMAIEYFDNDVNFLSRLKAALPEALVGAFGHLPSNFQRETLEATGADYVLAGEPDLSFRRLLENRLAGRSVAGEGVALVDESGQFINADFQRIATLDELPFADQSVIDHSLYGEPFFGHPFTTFLSSRGCPFTCTYCVRTYGRKFVQASAGHVVAEVTAAVRDHGIKHFRFMDDTFTASRSRLFEICEGLSQLEGIAWSCLSRPNTIDGEIAAALARAGCRRVYVGIESGSQKVLDYLKRGYQLDNVIDNLKEVRKSGLEMVGWFIVGSPVEEREDFEQSLKLARDLRLEFIAVSTLVPYPGTELFDMERENVLFNLFPYSCQFTDQATTQREAEFYRRYYLSPSYLLTGMSRFARQPGETLKASAEFVRYAVGAGRNSKRKDLL
jgi:radical SAM superfamily enzyme YgiQ (UPF0313 family)